METPRPPEDALFVADDAMQTVQAALDGQRILLTGGTGFFGKWLLAYFEAMAKHFGQRVSVTVLSRDPDRLLRESPGLRTGLGIDFISGDIRTFSARPEQRFDLVIHGATAASLRLEQEAPDEMRSVIVDGTRHLLDFLSRQPARRLLYLSSGAVYGQQPFDCARIEETFSGTPATAYGRGKREAEDMCLAAGNGRLDCVIARPFAFVGPYLPLDTHFAIGNFLRDCLQNRPIVIRGDGTPLRSYLYAADLAEWLLVLLVKGLPGRTYNVGSEDAISILDLAVLVRSRAQSTNAIEIQAAPVAGAPIARYVPSTARARSELGLTQRVSLEAAVDRTLSWHRRHRH